MAPLPIPARAWFSRWGRDWSFGSRFRVHGQRYGHQFTVWTPDGYHTTIQTDQNSAYGQFEWQQIANFDDGGNVWNPLEVMAFAAGTETGKDFWLRDDTTGDQFGIGQTDVLDGWQPLHAEPPLHPSFTLQVIAGRAGHTFSLGGVSLSDDSWGAVSNQTFVNYTTGEQYTLQCTTVSMSNPAPYASGPFTVSDNYSGDTAQIQPGVNDLRNWLPQPTPQWLNISTSRWGHDLVVHHLNGDEYPVENYGTQGFITATPNGPAYPVSYYYFLGGSLVHDLLPWYVIDRQTGESAGLYQDNLIDWIDLPKPGRLSVAGTSLPILTWPLEDASPFGAFRVERRVAGSPTWQPLTPDVPASAALTFTDSAPPALAILEYRVRYTFGGRFSAPSNVVPFSGDADGDGMPDWWEVRYGFGKNNPADGAEDYDHDGFTNLYEYQHHTDPTDYYNGVLPIITILSGDAQTTAPGAVLPQPLVAKVTARGTSAPLEDAPVAVGGGKINVPTLAGPPVPVSTLTLRTDAAGLVQVSFQQPERPRVRSRITVTATAGKRSARAEFRALTGPPPPGGPGGGGEGGGDPADDPDGDWDHDGLTNAEETAIGSDPQNPDSDGDGLLDGAEAVPTDEEILFPRAGAPHYALIDIGKGTINAINGKGEAVGMVLHTEGTNDEDTAFFWSKGERKTLQAPANGRKPEPRALNDSGAIVGRAEFRVPGSNPVEYKYRAAHWANADSVPTDLGSLGGKDQNDDHKVDGEEWGSSEAVAINNNGMIVGTSSHLVAADIPHGILYPGTSTKAVRFNVSGKPTLLGPGKKDDTAISNSVTALSEGGVAVGMTYDYHTSPDYSGAALWDNGAFSKELGEDFTPTGVTQAPASDTHYKYYVTGSTSKLDDPAPSPNGDGTTVADTGTRLMLKSKDSGDFITKKLPTRGALGITTNGLALAGGNNVWRNGNDVDISSDIGTADDSTFDGVSVQTASEIIGGSITVSGASLGAAPGAPPPKDEKHAVIGSAVFFRAENINLGFDPPMSGDRQPGAADPDEKKQEWWTKVARTDGTVTIPGTSDKYISHVNTNIHVVFNSEDEAKNYKIVVPNAYSSFISAEKTGGGSELTQKDTTIKITGQNPTSSPSPQHAQVSIEPKFQNAAKSKYTLDVDLLPVRKIILGIYFVQDTPTSGDLQIPGNFKNSSMMLQRLNEVFRQACVEFELAADSGVREVAYDINNNHKLDLPFSLISEGEYAQIFNPSPLSLLPKLNLPIVRDIAVPGKDDVGVTPQDRPIRHPMRSVVETNAFEGGGGKAEDLENFYATCAHEIGHALGLSSRMGADGRPHDPGMFPLINYKLDGGWIIDPFAYQGPRMDGGIMKAKTGTWRWMRHEDWKAANDNSDLFR